MFRLGAFASDVKLAKSDHKKTEPLSARDIPELMEMSPSIHQESQYRDWPYSEERVEKMWSNSFSTPSHFGVKYVRDGRIAGIFIGKLARLEFSPRLIGSHTLIWVRPEYRGGRCFYELVKEFLNWCETNGVPAFFAPDFNDDNEKLYRMFDKLGLKEFGRLYARGL